MDARELMYRNFVTGKISGFGLGRCVRVSWILHLTR